MLTKSRLLFAVLLAALVLAGPAQAQNARRLLTSGGVPSWVLRAGGVPATVDLNFATGQYYGCTLSTCLSITRASQKTNLLPSSASGFAYTTFANNTLAITPGLGLLIEESRTNQLLNSAVPATQTTGSLGTGTYTLWVNGSGSATMSAGTGTGCGTGTASQGSSISFTITVAGTCTVTVSGSLNAFQIELGAFGTSLIVTAGATATRAADNITPSGLLATTLQGTAMSLIAALGLTPTTASAPRIFAASGNADFFEVQPVNARTFNSSVTLDAAPGSGGWASAAKKVGFAADGLGRSIVFNNGTAGADANALSTYTRTTLFVGSLGGTSNFLDGYIQRITTFNIRLANSALGAITQ